MALMSLSEICDFYFSTKITYLKKRRKKSEKSTVNMYKKENKIILNYFDLN